MMMMVRPETSVSVMTSELASALLMTCLAAIANSGLHSVRSCRAQAYDEVSRRMILRYS